MSCIDNRLSHRNRDHDDISNDDQHDSWQPLRLPLRRLADRLHLQRATAILVAEAAGIPPVEAD